MVRSDPFRPRPKSSVEEPVPYHAPTHQRPQAMQQSPIPSLNLKRSVCQTTNATMAPAQARQRPAAVCAWALVHPVVQNLCNARALRADIPANPPASRRHPLLWVILAPRLTSAPCRWASSRTGRAWMAPLPPTHPLWVREEGGGGGPTDISTMTATPRCSLREKCWVKGGLRVRWGAVLGLNAWPSGQPLQPSALWRPLAGAGGDRLHIPLPPAHAVLGVRHCL